MLRVIRFELYKLFTSKKVLVTFLVLMGISLMLAVGINLMNSMEEAHKLHMTGQIFPVFLLVNLSDTLLPIMLVVLLVGLIADEYRDGTLKLPLLRPISRGELLLGKMAAAVVMVVVLMAVTLVGGYAAGTLIFGWEKEVIIGEQMFMVESVTQVLGFYLLTMIPFIAYSFIILFFSMMFANSGVAIGAAVGVHFMLLFTGGFFEKLQPAILNTYYYMGGMALTPTLNWQELLGNLAVISAYMLVFTVINFITFKKKDILY